MRSANGFVPVKAKTIIYKFMDSHWLDNVVQQRNKISRILETNDPFEFLAFNGKAYEAWVRDDSHRKVGFVSFAKRRDHILMWSRYANHHRGVALGFRVLEPHFFEVSYVGDRKPLTDEPTGKDVETLVFTKGREWQAEQEVRGVCPLNVAQTKVVDGRVLYFDPWSPSLELVSITLGVRCTVGIEDVQNCLRNLSAQVKIEKATISNDKFGLEFGLFA